MSDNNKTVKQKQLAKRIKERIAARHDTYYKIEKSPGPKGGSWGLEGLDRVLFRDIRELLDSVLNTGRSSDERFTKALAYAYLKLEIGKSAKPAKSAKDFVAEAFSTQSKTVQEAYGKFKSLADKMAQSCRSDRSVTEALAAEGKEDSPKNVARLFRERCIEGKITYRNGRASINLFKVDPLKSKKVAK